MIAKLKSKPMVSQRRRTGSHNRGVKTKMQTGDEYNSFWAGFFARTTGESPSGTIPLATSRHSVSQ